MTDKEILAELKRSYHYLVDIYENADMEQLSKDDKRSIDIATDYLANIYDKVYKNTKEDLICKNKLKVGNNIVADYSSEDNDFILSVDLEDGYKWWEDNKFIREI